MFRLFENYFQPGPDASVLDVGVTSDSQFAESNYFEKMYPYPHRITCVGTEDGSHLAEQFPGLNYQRVSSGQPLPFADRQFDVVFSNAVVEHVGSRESQARFIAELCRVGRAFFVTTPNRWFPVEHHTGLPLLHYLPAPIHRRILRPTKYSYWAEEENLNLLTASSFRGLFPSTVNATVRAVTLFGVPSNLVAFGRSVREG
jgi:SAM-dependent methyltransferase